MAKPCQALKGLAWLCHSSSPEAEPASRLLETVPLLFFQPEHGLADGVVSGGRGAGYKPEVRAHDAEEKALLQNRRMQNDYYKHLTLPTNREV